MSKNTNKGNITASENSSDSDNIKAKQTNQNKDSKFLFHLPEEDEAIMAHTNQNHVSLTKANLIRKKIQKHKNSFGGFGG